PRRHSGGRIGLRTLRVVYPPTLCLRLPALLVRSGTTYTRNSPPISRAQPTHTIVSGRASTRSAGISPPHRARAREPTSIGTSSFAGAGSLPTGEMPGTGPGVTAAGGFSRFFPSTRSRCGRRTRPAPAVSILTRSAVLASDRPARYDAVVIPFAPRPGARPRARPRHVELNRPVPLNALGWEGARPEALESLA